MCKLRDDTMSQAGELPMEKKMEDQGMFRPLKNLSAAEVSSQGGAVRGEAVALPDGWKIGNACNGRISVTKDGVGGYSAQRKDDNIASSILYELACSLRYSPVSPRAADAPSEPSDENDLLEVARALCSIAARRMELTSSQRANYPHVDEEGSAVLDAARVACVKRGYTEDGLSVEGVAYPRAADALDNCAPAAAAASAWQPIETAPRTGRTVLLGCLNSMGNWRTMRGQWFTKEKIEQDWEETDGFEAGWYETAEEPDCPNCWPIDPTHWMRLPAAPQSQEKP